MNRGTFGLGRPTPTPCVPVPAKWAPVGKTSLSMPRVVAKQAGIFLIGVLGVLTGCTPQVSHPSPSAVPLSTTRASSAVPGTLPGGQVLPSGAEVASVMHFQGRWVAAGDDFPGRATPALRICAVRGCNPIVWTSSTNRGPWTASWGVEAGGSIAGEILVAAPAVLLLFNGDEATSLWYSTDGVTWNRVNLPDAMSPLVVRAAVWGHDRFVVILNNKYAGSLYTAYGQSDTVWTSIDGTTWTEDSLSGPPAAFSALTVEPVGFRIDGTIRSAMAVAASWTSTDGITWTLSR